MDAENRRKAESYMRSARNKKLSKHSTDSILVNFLEAADYFEAISKKTKTDIYNTAMAYNEITIIYFNRRNYQISGEYCNKAIRQYTEMSFAPEDKELRHISALFVDFSDICMHLMREAEARMSLLQSIKAFKMIKNKTDAELAVGDPELNFMQYRTYMEQKLCDQSYLKSAEYCNHETLLADANDEAEMMGMFSSIALDEIQDYCAQITGLMQNMSVSSSSLFTLIDFSSPLDDSSYRSMAVNFLRLTQNHVRNGSVSHAKDTYLQARDALNNISCKTTQDVKIIQSIKKQIKLLKESQEPLVEQNEHISASLISRLGLFSENTQNSPQTPTLEYDHMEF